jgi:hypothetical protein
MESSLQSHFEIDEQSEMDYVFVNRDGIKYHATFYPVSDLYPQLTKTYSFSIEPEDRKAHPIDSKIATTIVEILKRFFKNNENAMIMVCDSLDGKESKRRKLFDRWFDHFADHSILKYDASAPLEDYQLYLSIYFRRDNPNKESLLRAFRDLLSMNLYELGI